MTNIQTANILFLDDEKEVRNITKDFFQKKGIPITTSDNFVEAMEQVSSQTFDVALCDLDLHKISKADGIEFLENVRNKNKKVFLCLYTIYENTISFKQKRSLLNMQIKIYDKNDPEVMFENLEDDYLKFLAKQKGNENNYNDFANDLFSTIKMDALKHLSNISNKEIYVQVTGINKNVTVSDLIIEINKGTEIGNQYIKDFYETTNFIKKLIQKHKV